MVCQRLMCVAHFSKCQPQGSSAVVSDIEMRVPTLVHVILRMEQKHEVNENSPYGETNIRSAGQEIPYPFEARIFTVMLTRV